MASASFLVYREQNEPGFYSVDSVRSIQNYTCDIILIHGLNGGPTSTWQSEETKSIWFQDMLPFYVSNEGGGPNARIWTFGYNANVAFGAAIAGIPDYARQLLNHVANIRQGCEHHKIIWVCHSLGGIVAKKVLTIAINTPIYNSIHGSTLAMLFLGTPHKGSGTADMGYLAARIYKKTTILGRPNDSLMKSLKTNSPLLQEIATAFEKSCESIAIFTYYEMLPMAISNSLIVPSESALTGLPQEVAVPLNANHRSICKYRNIRDPNWLVIRDRLVDLVKQTSTKIPSAPSSSMLEDSKSIASFMAQPPVGSPVSSPPAALITSSSSKETSIRGWRCNVCRDRILPFDRRFRCLECHNYDTCSPCRSLNLTALNHLSTHRQRSVHETYLLYQAHLEQLHTDVGVELDAIERFGIQSWAPGDDYLEPILILKPTPGHARLSISGLETGYFHIVLIVTISFVRQPVPSSQISRRTDLGTLRVAAGSPTERFSQDELVEDDSLIFQIFKTGTYKDGRLPAAYGNHKIELDEPILVLDDGEGSEGLGTIGLALQWSGGNVFQSEEDRVAISILQFRLEKLEEADVSIPVSKIPTPAA